MAFLDFLKNEKRNEKILSVKKDHESENIKVEEDEEWENLLPILKPIPLTMFDSVDLSRKKDDEKYAKKYNLRNSPLQGYDVINP